MNEAAIETVSYSSVGLATRLRWALQSIKGRLSQAVTNLCLRIVLHLQSDSNMLAHARAELRAMGYDPNQKTEDPDKWIQANLLQLVAVFVSQGHSGFSAAYATNAVAKLLRFEPLTPLTGHESEWNEVGTGVFQNRRCSHVFKQADRFNGQAYDINGRVFREPSGSCYTNGDCHVPITFPYTPMTVYVDVPEAA